MTLDEAINLRNLDYWGPGNPPLYVSEVYYGRLLIVTVDETQATS